ncbi:MAG: hypothetical protein GXP25_10750 [Planctomycetes bacterium]|nr:hypothetical protein [Planctomycetota bacterium]
MACRFRFFLLLILPFGLSSPSCGQDSGISPKALLIEAMDAARGIPRKKGYGDWKAPLLLLRMGETMQMHGMEDEAADAYRECQALNAKSEFDAVRDEIAAVLCRDLTLLGRTDEALALAGAITFRNYSAIGRYLIARTALEVGDAAAAEQAIRDAPALNRSAKARPDKRVEMWTRAFVRLAVRMKKPDLARALADTMHYEPWRSGGYSGIAVAMAKAGQVAHALKTAGEIPDPYMAVLGCSRLAAVLAKDADGLPQALDALNTAADKIKNEAEQGYALLFAVRRLSSAGLAEEAEQIAAKVKAPCLAARTRCELVTEETFDDATKAIAVCPEGDRPLLWEVLAISAGRRKLGDCARNAARHIGRPWQRLRALCSAAGALAKVGSAADAKRLLGSAAECVGQIDQPGWRFAAHIRLAIVYGDVGSTETAAQHLQYAKKELSHVKDTEVRDALSPRLVEAMLFLGHKEDARAAIMETLRDSLSPQVRGRLLPMLVQAGDPAGALARNKKRRLSNGYARQLLAFRLAEVGKVQEAVEYARALPAEIKANALVDIARALAPEHAATPAAERAVGVTLHGSWGGWFPRLERMGVRWEIMPFFEPYEIGAEGLRAKYIALGYPGTGGHFDHTSAVGVESIRDYVYSGGGFMGICAGQYLATKGDLATCGTDYLRGQGPHQVQIRKDHLISLGLPPVIVINRRNGGMMVPKPGCEVIGWYDKVDRYAALIAEQVGRGRVVAFSPHPEGSSGFIPRDCLSISALDWAMTGLP